MEFHWPWVFLLLPLPWLFAARRNVVSEPAPDLPLRLSQALEQMNDKGLHYRRSLWVLRFGVWLCFIVALAQPHIDGGSSVRPASGRAVMLALDLSASMSTQDFFSESEAQSRLDAVKQVATEFVSKRQGDRIGLVLFGSKAYVSSPLTFDTETLRALINEAQIGLAGRTTAIGQALGLGILRLRDDPAHQKAIILVTDGHNNSGGAEPEDASELASSMGIVVHTIGLGKPNDEAEGQSTDVDFKTLAAIA